MFFRNSTQNRYWVFLLKGGSISGLNAVLKKQGIVQQLNDSVSTLIQGPDHIAIPLNIAENETVEFRLSMRDYFVEVSVMSLREYHQYYLSKVHFRSQLYTLFLAVIVVLLAINIVYQITSKDKPYLNFTLHLVLLVLYIICRFNLFMAYLGRELPFGLEHLSLMFALGSMTFLARFAKGFLKIHEGLLHKSYYVIVLLDLFVVALLGALFVWKETRSTIAYNLSDLMFIITCTWVIVVAVT